MKRIIFALPFLIVSASYAQYQNPDFYLFRNMANGTNTKTIFNSSYTTATVDTTAWMYVSQTSKAYLNLQTKDTASCVVNFQASVDTGTTIGAATLLDSLNTKSNTGDIKLMDVTAKTYGASWIRFLFKFNSGAPQGVSTPTYSAEFVEKKY